MIDGFNYQSSSEDKDLTMMKIRIQGDDHVFSIAKSRKGRAEVRED
jgi:hypothetical protein